MNKDNTIRMEGFNKAIQSKLWLFILQYQCYKKGQNNVCNDINGLNTYANQPTVM